MGYIKRIGYACLNKDIENNIYKTLRLSNFSFDKMKNIIRNNLLVLKESIIYNIKNNIKMFRITSSLIPFQSLDKCVIDWMNIFSEEIEEIHKLIIDNDIRITVHPGQYIVINSINENVVEKSIKELEYHADILDCFGDYKSKMILHVGGIYSNKEDAIKRFIANYKKLSVRVRKYLVIENDDSNYTVNDVLYISSVVKVPVIFDNLHHLINNDENFDYDNIINKVMNTWKNDLSIPKMHFSLQAKDKRVGSHSDTIFVKDFLKFYEYIKDKKIDVMLEVKDKNRSALKIKNCLYGKDKDIEEEWARYKYLILSKSQKNYNDIRGLLKNRPIDKIRFYSIVEDSIYLKTNKNSFINSMNHIWGYFKKNDNTKEKEKYLKLIDDYINDLIKENRVLKYLYKLAVKYDVLYLKNSYIFKE